MTIRHVTDINKLNEIIKNLIRMNFEKKKNKNYAKNDEKNNVIIKLCN